MADPCAAQLATANSCVSRDPATCSCFTQPFIESFPREVTGAYFYTIAFETPGTTEFCAEANFNVCTQFETTASCCCGEEITEYTECMFTSALNIQFGAPGCEHTSCSNDREEAALGDVMLIIIGIIVVVLGCGGAGGFFCYLRRKRLGAFAGKAMDTRVRLDGYMYALLMESIYYNTISSTSSLRSLFRSVARPNRLIRVIGATDILSSRGGIKQNPTRREEASILNRNLTVIAPKTTRKRSSEAN
jgi:hypothetical protein